MGQYTEEPLAAAKYREAFRDGLLRHIAAERQKAAAERAGMFAARYPTEQAALRRELTEMFGYPLTGCKHTPVVLHKEKLTECFGCNVYRMQIEALPGVPFYGLYFEPQKIPKGGVPLVVACHGGSGTPEVVSGFVMDSANYHHMVERVCKHNVAVFAPQLYMWNKEIYQTDYDREFAANAFCQLGGSITALEITGIRKSVDALLLTQSELNGKMGIVGLSYGGMYAVCTAATDERFVSVYSSCWFNNREQYNWSDWRYFGQSRTFLDAEIAALIAPRALFIEVASRDELFASDKAEREFERLRAYYKIGGGNVRFRIFDGVHELAHDDAGFDFFFANLGI